MKKCNVCSNIFNIGTNFPANNKCPITSCNGEIFDAEDDLFYPLLLLNQKGYNIEKYCPWESPDNELSIVFHLGVQFFSFDYPPNYFKYEKCADGRFRFYYKISALSEKLQKEEKKKIAQELSIWAEDLSESEEMFIEFEVKDVAKIPQFLTHIKTKLDLYNVWVKDNSVCCRYTASLNKIDEILEDIKSFIKKKKGVKITYNYN
jgi:hypothetical protein